MDRRSETTKALTAMAEKDERIRELEAALEAERDKHNEWASRREQLDALAETNESLEAEITALREALENIRDCKDYECCEDLIEKAKRALKSADSIPTEAESDNEGAR